MTTIFRVNKRIDKNGHSAFRMYSGGHHWNHKDIEELEKIHLIFSKTMDVKDIERIKERWKHKL